MASRIRLNSRGMDELLNSDSVRADMLRRAERVAAVARDTAPVDSDAYKASIHAETATTDRAVGRVVADVDYALALEFHTRNLGRALDAAGD